jgi:hypothetical protein
MPFHKAFPGAVTLGALFYVLISRAPWMRAPRRPCSLGEHPPVRHNQRPLGERERRQRSRPEGLKTAISRDRKQSIFVSAIAPIDPRIETAEEVRDRVLEASEYKPVEQLSTTDNRRFATFSDDTSTGRDTTSPRLERGSWVRNLPRNLSELTGHDSG